MNPQKPILIKCLWALLITLFTVSQSAAAPVSLPEIDVRGNHTPISDGDTSPSVTDSTDIGGVKVSSESRIVVYKIHNTGTGTLNLTGSPRVELSGTHAADFTVSQQPAASVAAGDSTEFRITFDASDGGTREVTVSIASDDGDENPYTFDIEGYGSEPFGCVPNFYHVYGPDGKVSYLDPISDPYTYIPISVAGYQLNAAGFSEQDGFMYAIERGTEIAGDRIVRIAGDGHIDVMPQIPTFDSYKGDCDTGGMFYIINSGGDKICVTDLNGTSVNQYNISGQKWNAKDIAYMNADGLFYGVDGKYLYIYNHSTRTSSRALISGRLADDVDAGVNQATWGVTWTANDGYVYCGNNHSGRLYKINRTTRASVYIGTGVGNLSYNDGSSCPTANPPFPTTGKIGDRVWLDANNDGIQDDGELGVEGVTVSVYQSDNTFVNSTTTDSEGEFMFEGLTAATYYLIFSGLPSGFQFGLQNQGSDDNVDSDPNPADGKTANIQLDVSETEELWDAAVRTTGLGNYVWIDSDKDGRQDSGESGIQGIKVILFTSGGSRVDSTTTDVDGYYIFGGLATGDYYLQFTDLPSGYQFTSQNQGDDTGDSDANASGITATTTLTSYEFEANWDAGIYQTNNPEMVVRGNGQVITDGDDTPVPADDTDFGDVNVETGSNTNTFTIQNTGSGILNLTGTPKVAVSGSHAAEFTVTVQPTTPISASGSVTFNVTFNPAAEGTRVAFLSIANDDSDENPYNFMIKGKGVSPEMTVEGNGNTIDDEDSTPASSDHTDFGSVNVASGNIVRTYVISNSGTDTLSLNGSPKVSITGTHSGDFSVTALPSSPVALGGGFTSFQVTFDPSGAGLRSASVSIDNNDADENPYNFDIQGTGIGEEEILVKGNDTEISDGDTSPSTADDTDFGSTDVTTGTVTKTFTIYNTGTDTLFLTGSPDEVVISGTHASDFTVTSAPGDTVLPGDSTSFDVEFNPSGLAIREASISIANTDADENPYNFDIQGTGTGEEEMLVKGNNTEISDGDTSPSTTDDTDFGSTDVTTGTVTKTFTIYNTGTDTLFLTGSPDEVVISGTHAANFTVTSAPSGTILPGDSADFDVEFDPSGLALREATISIANTDADENPYNYDIQGTGTGQEEMLVKGNDTEISDGDTSPSTTDDTNFGSTDVTTGTVTKTFTIYNTGTDTLFLTGSPDEVVISGTHASDFTVTSAPGDTVLPGDSTSFDVEFDPSNLALREASISIANTDADENPYNFDIQGTGTGTPEIDVQGNGVSIADGDNSPSAADDTDFGSQDISSPTKITTFTIKNTGNTVLNLTDPSPYISITGHTSDFTLRRAPSSTIAVGDTSTFEIEFNATATGIRSATISIANSDTNENPYNFNIQGTGTATPEIAVQGNENWIVDGDASPSVNDNTDFGSANVGTPVIKSYKIFNFGSDTLFLTGAPVVLISGSHSGDFVVTSVPSTTILPGDSGEFQITFTPSALNLRQANLSIANNDTNENPYNFSIQGAGTGEEEMLVKGNDTEISDGDTSPSTTDDTDFGSTDVTTGSVTKTFTIYNTGTDTLFLTGSPDEIVISGTHAADFTVTSAPSGTILPGDSADFDVEFDPSGLALREATLSIANTDADENPYNFDIQGTGTGEEEMLVKGNDTEISDGDTSPSTTDDTDFGNADVSTGTVTKTFTIYNTGTDTLFLTGSPDEVVISGTHASDFTVTSAPSSTILPGDSVDFDVEFDPSGLALREATISIANTDADENPYNFDIQGTGTGEEEMLVKGNDVEISDGDTSPSTTDDTDFGSTDVTTGTVTKTFTIYNTGTDTLFLTGSPDEVVISGTHASDFTVTSAPSGTIFPGDSADFDVEFDPSGLALRKATLSIANTDADENPYNFDIQGTGTGVTEMLVKGNDVEISDGDTSPSTTDDTDFGTTDVTTGTITKTFTIYNTGTDTLFLTDSPDEVVISGTHASDFTVTSAPSGTILPGDSADFDVEFDPSGLALREATISIANTDADENPYNFDIQGTGTGVTEMLVKGNDVEISDGDTSPSTTDDTDFGTTDLATGTVLKSFLIKNTGTDTLFLTGKPDVTFSGTHASDFKVTLYPKNTILPGDSAEFQVEFDPSGLGVRQAQITIPNTDADENPYNYAIQGKGAGATVSSIVWHDTDRDGIQDPGESGMPGIIATLYDSSGTQIGQPDTTDANGAYTFGPLSPDKYYIVFSGIPAGYQISPRDNGDDTKDSDADPATGKTHLFALGLGQSNTTVAMGINLIPAILNGLAWHDTDRDGLRESGETGMSGIVVALLDTTGKQVGLNDTTDTNGRYQFTDLEPGNYRLQFFLPSSDYQFSPKDQGGDDNLDSDVKLTSGETDNFLLTPAQEDTSRSAGLNLKTVQIGNYVYHDANGNRKADDNEKGIPDVEVVLMDNNYKHLQVQITDQQGQYMFTNLEPDTYMVGIQPHTLPPDYQLTTNNSPVKVILSPGQSYTWADFGYRVPLGSIGDLVWHDQNGNGLKDTSETGLKNITVVLTDTLGSLIAIDSTNSDGFYLFDQLKDSTYMVTVFQADPDLPANFYLTTGNNPHRVDLVPGQNYRKADFGFVEKSENMGVIGDYAWHDADWDRWQDIEEEDLPYVMLYLFKWLGSQHQVRSNAVRTAAPSYPGYALLDSIQSDFYGYYNFTGLSAGKYLIRADHMGPDPEGRWIITSIDTKYVTLGEGQIYQDADFGFAFPSEATPGTVTQRLFHDENQNRKRDPEEIPLAGVTVQLMQHGALVAELTTDGNGQVKFEDVNPGDYVLTVLQSSLPENYINTTGNEPAPLFLAANVDFFGEDMGYAAERSWGIDRNYILALYEPYAIASSDSGMRHWNGQSDTSRIGLYNSQIEKVLELHILQAWTNGIDGFAVDWAGWNSFENRTLKMMLDKTDALHEEYRDKGFTFEIALAYNEQAKGGLDTNLIYISDSIMTHDAYWGVRRQVRRPVFVLNDDDTLVTINKFSQCADTTLPFDIISLWQGIDTDAFGPMDVVFPDIQPELAWDVDGKDWGDAYLDTVYTQINTLPVAGELKFALGTVWPGFDDRQWPAGQNRWMDRQDTTVYQQTWSKVLDYDKTLSMPWCLISSWNDFNQGTQIEPSLEHLYKFNVMTRDNARQFKASLPADSVGMENMGLLVPQHLYQARKAAEVYPALKDSIDNQTIQVCAQFMDRNHEMALSLADRAADIVPPAFTIQSVTDSSVTLAWNDSSATDQYRIHFSEDNARFTPCAFLTPDAVTVMDTSEYTLHGLKPETEYYIAITAIDSELGSYANEGWFANTLTGTGPVKITTTEGTTGINAENGLPKTFALDQNYPNPFNPVTHIQYALPKAQHVTVTVYNILGQQVTRLVDAKQQPGYYKVNFDANQYASGVYFYRIKTEAFTAIRKMMIVK